MNKHYDQINHDALITITPMDVEALDAVTTSSPEVREAWHCLSSKQQSFVLNILQDMPHYQAYQLAYKLPNSNRNSMEACASIALRTANIKIIMGALRARRDNDLERVINTLTEANMATKDVVTVNSDGVTEVVKAPDWAIRLKAADQLAKLHALNAPVKQIVDVRSTVIRYHKPERDPIDHIDSSVSMDSIGLDDLPDPDSLNDLGS